jgi:hypothetical protein
MNNMMKKMRNLIQFKLKMKKEHKTKHPLIYFSFYNKIYNN